MQYLSEFEILSEPIVPPNLLPGGVAVPFVAQGYFVLVSRLVDAIPGDLTVAFEFVPSSAFPPAASLLVDYEDGTGANQLIALPASNTVSVPIASGKTILFGIQPDVVNTAANGPLASGAFGVRGYVMIDAGLPSHAGTYQLAVVPEIRATFFSVNVNGDGTASPNFADASEVAYALPTAAAALLTVTKSKEGKEKEKDKEAFKDIKDLSDGKRHPDKIPIKDIRDSFEPKQQEPTGLAALSERLAALEKLIGSDSAFITPDERPKVG